ncbi:universal stress protein [Variovorax sp. RT4R15]|uniref:universal stress protein n=1 Tax=Variovorax sp. RT4R15 TaxID=3443737 RepID=UPI003F46F601
MYERILVATDGSDLSEQAVTTAIDLAVLTRAELVAVHVIRIHAQSYFEGALLLSQEETHRTQERADLEGQRVVEAVKARALTKGVRNVMPVTLKSNQIAEAIIEAAKQHKCGLIVMASHGRRAIQRLLMGSETMHVLTHSHTPVLVLR